MNRGIACERCLSCPVLSRMTLRKAVASAREQIEIEAFLPGERNFAEELCLVMAEVYLMDPSSPIRVGGEVLDGYLVGEVFGQIRHEHVELVMRNFRAVSASVKNKKAYLRTSLYQSVFEWEAHYVNLVSHDRAEKEL